jgi:hypothetical protein
MVQDGLSYRYTIMSLLGLLEYERAAELRPFRYSPQSSD